jgi:hypothetical protein
MARFARQLTDGRPSVSVAARMRPPSIELDPLTGARRGFGLLPEAVAGEGRRDQRCRQAGCRQARQEPEREEHARARLYGAVEPHQRRGVLGQTECFRQGGGESLSPFELAIRVEERIHTTGDEHARNERTGETMGQHATLLTPWPGLGNLSACIR